MWCDEQPDQGPLHADIKLAAGGESVMLFDIDGRTEVDQVEFPPQTPDVSYGRHPDGDDLWDLMAEPTPGASNAARR